MIRWLLELWSGLIILAFAPALLIHELLHIAVGSRWSLHTKLDWQLLNGRPQVHFAYPLDLERWKIVLANIAPALVGIVIAPIAYVLVSSHGLDDPIGIYLGLSWLAIALPSGDDLAVILE